MLIDPKNFDRFNMILTGVVVPRPIAFVSTISTEGVVNLARTVSSTRWPTIRPR